MKNSRLRGTPYNIYLSLLYLREKLKKLDVDVFVPELVDAKIDFCDLGMLWIVQGAILINFHIDKDVLSFINSSKKRYTIVFLGLVDYCDNNRNFINGHCNMLIFDSIDYNLYRIDSSGYALNSVFSTRTLDSRLRSTFNNYTLLIFDIPIQIYQENENRMSIGDPRGFCLPWSILCTEYTIKNKYYTFNNLTRLIRRYSEKILKRGEEIRCRIVNSIYYG